MGWTMPFVSSRGTSFADDCGAGGGFALSVYGRQEDWEDSPPGWPPHPAYG